MRSSCAVSMAKRKLPAHLTWMTARPDAQKSQPGAPLLNQIRARTRAKSQGQRLMPQAPRLILHAAWRQAIQRLVRLVPGQIHPRAHCFHPQSAKRQTPMHNCATPVRGRISILQFRKVICGAWLPPLPGPSHHPCARPLRADIPAAPPACWQARGQ